MGQLHSFGTKTQLEVLSNLGDPLIKANQLIDLENISQTNRKHHTQRPHPRRTITLRRHTQVQNHHTTTMVWPIRHVSPIYDKRPLILYALSWS
jgi:hypothetical protein